MATILFISDFRHAKVFSSRPALEPPPVSPPYEAVAHLFTLSVYLALTMVRQAQGAHVRVFMVRGEGQT